MTSIPEAYSEERDEIIDPEVAWRLSLHGDLKKMTAFRCASPGCGAKLSLAGFGIRSELLAYSPYFRLLASSEHIKGCPYMDGITGGMDLNEQELEKIGEGYFAEVYRSERGPDRFVAVKVARKGVRLDGHNVSAEKRFQREIECLEQLHEHKNIIGFIGACTYQGRPAYACEYCLGSMEKMVLYDLENNMRKDIFLQICAAVRHAHSKGYLHRDLHPGNILLADGTGKSVRVSDFGLGVSLAEDRTRTRSNISRMGRVGYVSPEQQRDLRNASFQSDIYSLGMLLQKLFTGDDPTHQLQRCCVTSVVKKATEFDPDSRHKTVDELIEHFERVYALTNDNSFSENVLATPKGEKVNWLAFCNEVNSVNCLEEMGDHIDLVSERSKELQDSYQAIGDQIDVALLKLLSELSERQGEVGITWSWVTSSIFTIGKVIIAGSTDPDAKLDAAMAMWQDAIIYDQWAKQDETIEIVLSVEIPEDVQPQLADWISVGKKCIENQRVPSGCPLVLRNAVRMWNKIRDDSSDS